MTLKATAAVGHFFRLVKSCMPMCNSIFGLEGKNTKLWADLKPECQGWTVLMFHACSGARIASTNWSKFPISAAMSTLIISSQLVH